MQTNIFVDKMQIGKNSFESNYSYFVHNTPVYVYIDKFNTTK